MSSALTLGAEEELHLVDVDTLKLSQTAAAVLERLPSDQFQSELQRSTVEANTKVVSTLGELRGELTRLRRLAADAAELSGAALAAVGITPGATPSDFEQTPNGRFDAMHAAYGLLVDEHIVCSLQVHVGVDDRDLAVEIAQRVERTLPLLLAISASSPYWGDFDTGYSSFRTMVWRRWPSAGATGRLRSAAEYDQLLEDLIRSGVISDVGMAYFDVRPSAHAPTVELRVCDTTPRVDDSILIAGLFRAAVREAELQIQQGVEFRPWLIPVRRAATWRASRSGLEGQLLTEDDHPTPLPAQLVLGTAVRRLRPSLEALGDYEEVSTLARAIVARGSSAARQRRIIARGGTLQDVLRSVVAETRV